MLLAMALMMLLSLLRWVVMMIMMLGVGPIIHRYYEGGGGGGGGSTETHKNDYIIYGWPLIIPEMLTSLSLINIDKNIL